MVRNSLPVWGYRRGRSRRAFSSCDMSNTATAPTTEGNPVCAVRFNDKPEARHKCSPAWERFTTRLDVAKLNMRLLSDSLESGTGGSNSLRSAKHIWTPPVSRVELLTRFGTQLQSYIRPGYRASDEALALMDCRALRSADQSGGLSRPCVATEFGSAGPTGSPSASHKTPYATSARAGFSAPKSLWPHAVFRSALS